MRRRSFLGCVASILALVQSSPAPSQERIQVITTTTDLRSLTEMVGGDLLDVSNLVPANFDAEEYQSKPQDVLRLKNARLVVRVGLDYDLWFDRLLQASAKADIKRAGPAYVDASYGIAALEVRGVSFGPGDGHAYGSGNPHYWLDPKNAEFITSNILAGLARIDPDNAKTYEANREAFLTRLAQKVGEWEERLAPLKSMPIIPNHNACPCSPRRFRLEFTDFLEIKPGVPPTPSHLAGIIQIRRAGGVRMVVREPHEPERDAAFLAQKTGASVVVLATTVGGLPGARDYLSLFETNVGALVEAAGAR